jgi:hypothetical protein
MIDETATKDSETDNAPKIVSGLMASIASIETSVVHMTRSATARLDLFTSAPPKTVSLEEDSSRSHENLLNELRLVRQQLSCTYEALGRALGQLSASNAHCTTIHRELGDVRLQFENATKKKERGSKKIKARFLTGANLRAEFERQDAERREQEHVAAEKEKQKEAESAERAQRVAADALNRDFAGRLTSYKKDDLRALAIALSISDKGTNAELLSRIEDCFKTNHNLKNNSRFSGLFSKQRKVTTGPQSQQQLPRTPTAGAIAASHPAIPTQAGTSHVPTAGPSHVSNLPLAPLPQPYSNPYNHLHPQNNYPYNASHIPPQTVTYPNPNAHLRHGLIPHPYYYSIPQSDGSNSLLR